MAPPSPHEPTDVAAPSFDPDDVRRRWDANAGWWDDTVGEGNVTQRLILGPATERLLQPKPGQRILDLACGNGHFGRRLADLGASVVAVDFSEVFLERARRRSSGYDGRVDFRRVDLNRPDEIASLGAQRFDAAVCTMALMDMADIRPVFRGLATLLTPGAPFVFSVTHPVFNQTSAVPGMERVDSEGGSVERYYVRVDRYNSPRKGLGTGIVGQPMGHWYFERTITNLLTTGFDTGFVVDAFEELGYPEGTPSTRTLGWSTFSEIPPFLIIRMRRPSEGSR